MTYYLIQTLEMAALTIAISMAVAVMIICLNKILFALEDMHKRHTDAADAASNNKDGKAS